MSLLCPSHPQLTSLKNFEKESFWNIFLINVKTWQFLLIWKVTEVTQKNGNHFEHRILFKLEFIT
jgi:hypothetical protein